MWFHCLEVCKHSINSTDKFHKANKGQWVRNTLICISFLLNLSCSLYWTEKKKTVHVNYLCLSLECDSWGLLLTPLLAPTVGSKLKLGIHTSILWTPKCNLCPPHWISSHVVTDESLFIYFFNVCEYTGSHYRLLWATMWLLAQDLWKSS